MAIQASLVITGIAIGLLLVYGADVAASINIDGEVGERKNGFLPLNDCLLYTSPSPRDRG